MSKSVLALLAVGTVALGSVGGALVGCGGDDESASEVTPVTAPPLTGPEEGTSTALTEETTTTVEEAGTETVVEGGTGATPAPEETGGVSPAPDQGGDDTPQNDTPPPQNSPAERFEKFCQDNPGAC